mmetsp:Transcript_5574/g.10131  ORF Transcript_5574/g.10131 Transcript_5574/m.10131 type:complete len:424 (+) Transcript_5574:683-1954(+)
MVPGPPLCLDRRLQCSVSALLCVPPHRREVQGLGHNIAVIPTVLQRGRLHTGDLGHGSLQLCHDTLDQGDYFAQQFLFGVRNLQDAHAYCVIIGPHLHGLHFKVHIGDGQNIQNLVEHRLVKQMPTHLQILVVNRRPGTEFRQLQQNAISCTFMHFHECTHLVLQPLNLLFLLVHDFDSDGGQRFILLCRVDAHHFVVTGRVHCQINDAVDNHLVKQMPHALQDGEGHGDLLLVTSTLPDAQVHRLGHLLSKGVGIDLGLDGVCSLFRLVPNGHEGPMFPRASCKIDQDSVQLLSAELSFIGKVLQRLSHHLELVCGDVEVQFLGPGSHDVPSCQTMHQLDAPRHSKVLRVQDLVCLRVADHCLRVHPCLVSESAATGDEIVERDGDVCHLCYILLQMGKQAQIVPALNGFLVQRVHPCEKSP